MRKENHNSRGNCDLNGEEKVGNGKWENTIFNGKKIRWDLRIHAWIVIQKLRKMCPWGNLVNLVKNAVSRCARKSSERRARVWCAAEKGRRQTADETQIFPHSPKHSPSASATTGDRPWRMSVIFWIPLPYPFTGIGKSTKPRFGENEDKKLRSSACYRQENATFYPLILGTWAL